MELLLLAALSFGAAPKKAALPPPPKVVRLAPPAKPELFLRPILGQPLPQAVPLKSPGQAAAALPEWLSQFAAQVEQAVEFAKREEEWEEFWVYLSVSQSPLPRARLGPAQKLYVAEHEGTSAVVSMTKESWGLEPPPEPKPVPYARLLGHLDREWASYRAKGGTSKAFFADVFWLGRLWWRPSHIGPRPSAEAAEYSALRAARKHLPPPEADAFGRFASRLRSAWSPDSENGRRKRLEDALLEASLRDDAVAYLDSLYPDAEDAVGAYFRRGQQKRVLAELTAEAEKLIAASDNVVGLLLMGSYGTEQARPQSDFDFVVLTRDGTHRGVGELLAGLETRRKERGWPGWDDWIRYGDRNVMKPGARARRLARQTGALLISPDGELLNAFGRRPPPKATKLDLRLLRLTEPGFRFLVRQLLERSL